MSSPLQLDVLVAPSKPVTGLQWIASVEQVEALTPGIVVAQAVFGLGQGASS
jgi:hypothetical protein